jgi:hypothetical protein
MWEAVAGMNRARLECSWHSKNYPHYTPEGAAPGSELRDYVGRSMGTLTAAAHTAHR